MNSFEEIKQVINNYENFYITGHINPDGDSIGSCNCLRLALEQMGKHVVTITRSDCQEDQAEQLQLDSVVFIQVDVQPEYRIAKDALKIKNKATMKICFDHHQLEDSKCDLFYVDSNAAANALIIWDFVNFLDVKITSEIATWAYYGLSSDTNSFMNTNTSKRVFEVATDMLNYDVDAAKVAQELFQSRSLASFGLEKVVLDNLYVDSDNRFAFSYLTWQDYAKFSATKADSDAMIDLLRQLECVDVACIIRQEKNGDKIHGSLRSKTQVDVSKLARLHTGGGHKAAAGLTIDMTDMNKAIDIIKSQLVDLMQGKI